MVLKKNNDYTLYTLGARGSRPVHGKDFDIFGGQTTCFILKYKKHAVIIDCGTGLYEAKEILKDCELIDVIFTHVHYDHILGLLDCSVFPSNARINFMGTFKYWLQTETISDFFRHPFWPIQPNVGVICEICNDGTSYNLADGFLLEVHKASHPDFGNVIILHCGDKKISFMFDLEVEDGLNLEIIKNSDFLIFDGMFDESEYQAHKGWGHSTYTEGCALAIRFNCKQLLITHHNPSRTDKELIAFEARAKKVFCKTRFCRAGDIFTL